MSSFFEGYDDIVEVDVLGYCKMRRIESDFDDELNGGKEN